MEKTKEYSRNESIDRLSALPDAILCHILSFLSTKHFVATSILSRRWRFLWAHVPNLDFDIEDHERESKVDDMSFFDIIYGVMSLYKVENMDTFSLRFIGMSQSQLETCICAAVLRNVKNISLIAPSFPPVSLPCCIASCKTLVDLTLCNIWELPMIGDICLLALKRLYLGSVFYGSDESLPHLLSGCPVLEELTVERMDGDVACFYISSPTLNRLMLSSYFDNGDESYSEAYTLKIDTPALRYLQVFSRTRYEDISVGSSLTSLIEADVDLEYESPIERGDFYSRSTLEFVGRLCNVKCLKLSTGWMEVPDSAFSALTAKFHNLTKLEIAADWRFISNFLGNADNLEVLLICSVDEYLKYWMEPKKVPTCLLLHLGTVRIDQFGCTEQEFNMVRYILKNGKVLKRMEIYSGSHGIDLMEKFDALKRISMFQRGSEACELVFY